MRKEMLINVNISCDPFTGEREEEVRWRWDKKMSMIPIHPDLYNSGNFVFKQNKGFCKIYHMVAVICQIDFVVNFLQTFLLAEFFQVP